MEHGNAKAKFAKISCNPLGVHNEVLVFPNELHGFLRHESWLCAYKASADFFDRFLKGEKNP